MLWSKGASLVGQVYSRHVSLKGFYYIYVASGICLVLVHNITSLFAHLSVC